ncbi:hypothetical protein LCGC14_1284520 [marine sediment metagenome]|uniref:Uncharacterized protein n=1 Tax=marine sediment metagenome TaxID=412755 RepID=A0A0F9NAX0_9ZZZZ|nr:hypothetical protein [Pricia sp.]
MSSNFGHVKRVTQEVGGKTYTFRSLLEYRWSVYCEFRKQQGIIADWTYEDPQATLELEKGYHLNVKEYHPDFTILYPNGDYETEETKGYFPPKDYTTLKLAAEQYENPITLIFASTAKNPKSASIRAQIRRAERLEPHIKRIIWNANKDIFEDIKFLFDE